MKVEEVKKLSPLDRFIYWVRERHNIYLRRKAGKPKPWTDDEVMQSYFFTHPYRELDKVTVWFRENVREPLRDDPAVLMATVIFRWFNLPETAEVLMDGPIVSDNSEGCLLLNWDAEEAVRRLAEVRERGKKIFTGAFMINSPAGEPKLEAICRRIDAVWEDRERLIDCILDKREGGYWERELARKGDEGAPTMEGVHKLLTQYDGLGGFMAYEVVCDLRYTYLLENAPDKLTWCNPGPGAIRGLYRLSGEEFEKGNNSASPPRPKDWQQRMVSLLETATKRLRGMPPLEMREIEHSLCEYDKYERALAGDGRMKRTYTGRG